jgi:hypothetical protein
MTRTPMTSRTCYTLQPPHSMYAFNFQHTSPRNLPLGLPGKPPQHQSSQYHPQNVEYHDFLSIASGRLAAWSYGTYIRR